METTEAVGEGAFLPPIRLPHKPLHPIPLHCVPRFFRNGEPDSQALSVPCLQKKYAPDMHRVCPAATRKYGFEGSTTAQRLAQCHAETFNAVGDSRFRLPPGSKTRPPSVKTAGVTYGTDVRIVLVISAG